MRPCSVRYDAAGCGPPTTQGKEVEIRDAAGTRLASWSVRGCSEYRGVLCNVVIRYPRQGEGDCPSDARTQYILLLHNAQKRDLWVIVEGKELGVLPAWGEARFGPLDGDWATFETPRFRDSAGAMLQPSEDYLFDEGPVEYDLGEVPVVTLYVGYGLRK